MSPSSPSADHNLLFGVLALQADLIDCDRFVQVCTLWASRKDTPLAALLVEQGWLSPDDRADVERLLARKLKKHNGDARASLAEAAGPPARAALANIADPDVERSVAGLSTVQPAAKIKTEDPTGERAGRNLLFEEIGHGGMGVVLRGRDPDLGRDLAVKLLRPEHQGDAGLECRFVEEAQIGGQLQHPGVVPVYELGRFSDQRPYFTMKLIKGRTLKELLNAPVSNRPEPAKAGCKPGTQGRTRLLSIFEQVCQAVAYAHSKGVIHRDLKPANIMVGAFGEVQVMDWGLAKILTRRDDDDPEGTTAGTMIRTARTDSTAEAEGRTGVVGTPAYMAPEQARGDIDAVDERADVFGLGGILCVILSGEPPFVGSGREEVMRKAAAGDLAETCNRLAACGAEADLVALAQACLASNREDRPRNAGEVAQRMSAYFAGVQERLRKAELERAAAEACAEESAKKAEAERRTRRAVMGLATALLLLVMAGGGIGWMVQQRVEHQRQTDREVAGILKRAEPDLEKGWRLNDLSKLNAAKAEADRAAALARNSASAEVRRQSEAFSEQVEERLRRARKNDLLRVALLNVSAPRETSRYQDDGSGQMMAMAELSIEDQYAEAFRRWGMDVLAKPETDVVARLREEPEVVVQDVIAALDAWTLHLRRQQQPKTDWRHLYRLAEQLDRNERSKRLRAMLVEGTPPRAESVVGLLSGNVPLLAWWHLDRGVQWKQLQHLRNGMDPTSEPVLTVVLLSQTLSRVGDEAGAEEALRQALAARPNEVVVLDSLGKLLERQGTARLGEVIACYQAIRARDSRLGVSLGRALWETGKAAEGEWVLRDLVHQQPQNPETYFYLGVALYAQKKLDEAMAAWRKAIVLKPDLAGAHFNLGNVLGDQKKLNEAEAAYRRAIMIKPDFAWAHFNLGNVLRDQKKLNQAEAACRKAIALKPDEAVAYSNLGNVLHDQKKLDEAVAAHRKAITLKPDLAGAYINLGAVLSKQNKLDEAVAVFRKAIALKPDLSEAYISLGAALADQKKLNEAVSAIHKAIALKPDYAEAFSNLGNVLRDQKKLNQAEAACRKAIALKPDEAVAYSNLGNVLHDQKKLDEAVAAHRKAIVIKPDYAQAYISLGIVLRDQKKLDEAVAAYRKAIVIKPDYAQAYISLGSALRDQQKLDEAVAAYRKAIVIKPDYAQAYYSLGNVLHDQKKLDEAVAAYRKAIVIKPDYAQAHCNLGNVLRGQKKLDEAVAVFRKAIALKPDLSEAYISLGTALHDQKKLTEAVTVFRSAIVLKPDYAELYYNLGIALSTQNKLEEAAAAYRKTIVLKPDLAQAHCNLGGILQFQGKFADSLAAYRRGHALGSQQAGWPYPSAQWVRQAQRLVELDEKLPAILKGDTTPKNAAERIELSNVCLLKHWHASAARFYTDAFAEDVSLIRYRYNAACAAALAGCGQGEDKLRPDDEERARLRKQALDWLHADLTGWSIRLERGKPEDRAAILGTLRHWQGDSDLAGLRDKDALSKLPEDERKQWRKLWADVDALIQKAAAKK